MLETLSQLAMYKRVHTQSAATLCSDPTAPTNKNTNPEDELEGLGVIYWQQLTHICFLPKTVSFKAQAEPSRRAVSERESRERSEHIFGRHVRPQQDAILQDGIPPGI